MEMDHRNKEAPAERPGLTFAQFRAFSRRLRGWAEHEAAEMGVRACFSDRARSARVNPSDPAAMLCSYADIERCLTTTAPIVRTLLMYMYVRPMLPAPSTVYGTAEIEYRTYSVAGYVEECYGELVYPGQRVWLVRCLARIRRDWVRDSIRALGLCPECGDSGLVDMEPCPVCKPGGRSRAKHAYAMPAYGQASEADLRAAGK